MPPKSKSENVPAAMKPRYDEITAATDAFCRQHLNDEYAQVCREMTAAIGRKRPSPLATGKANTWAAGIVQTVGGINFLFDKSQALHMRSDDLAAGFGLSKSTVANKSKEIKDLLKISMMDPAWTLPSRMERNTRAWLISVDGFILDARSAPRPIQEQAFRMGLIPYIPGEREE
jgi:hypothetical protein